jgi:nitroreductase
MNAVTEALLGRVSSPRLTSPAPSGETLERILKCALRAPDHALLRPWRFIVFADGALTTLSDIFVLAGRSQGNMKGAREQEQDLEDKLRSMVSRAPMIIVGIVCYQAHPKVPRQEQLLSAGSTFAYMLAALQSEGFGGIWRTGPMATDPVVREQLGLGATEEIFGYLYAGTPIGEPKKIPDIPLSAHFVFQS